MKSRLTALLLTLALLLTALMVLSLAACGAKDDSKADNGGETIRHNIQENA